MRRFLHYVTFSDLIMLYTQQNLQIHLHEISLFNECKTFQSLNMALAVNIMNRCGLSNRVLHECLLKKTKVI